MNVFNECGWIVEVINDTSFVNTFIMTHLMGLTIFNEFSFLKLLLIAKIHFASMIVMLKGCNCLNNVCKLWSLVINEIVIEKMMLEKLHIWNKLFLMIYGGIKYITFFLSWILYKTWIGYVTPMFLFFIWCVKCGILL